MSECRLNSEVEEAWQNNEAEIIKLFSDQNYIRYTGRDIECNDSLNSRTSNTQYFWTLSNPYTSVFRDSLQLRDSRCNLYEDYDDRTTLNELSAVQYYVVKNDDDCGMPYGYELIGKADARLAKKNELEEKLKNELGVTGLTEEQLQSLNENVNSEEYAIYENRYALPLGFCYDKYISREIWDSLDPVQKQEIELDAVYAEISSGEVEKYSGEIKDYMIPYEVTCNDRNISELPSGFVATDTDTSIEVTFDSAVSNSETYIGFEGIQFIETPEYDLYFGDEKVDPLKLYNKTNWELLTELEKQSIKKDKMLGIIPDDVNITVKADNGVKKVISHIPEDVAFSSGKHDYIVNLGYSAEPLRKATITFPKRGIYTFDSIRVYNIPLGGYEEKTKNLKATTLQDIAIDTDKVTGSLETDSDKILCLAIPFSPGWKGFVDGKETEVLCANERYLGLEVPAGKHNIEFQYELPHLTEGIILTVIGFLAFGIMIYLSKKHTLK